MPPFALPRRGLLAVPFLLPAAARAVEFPDRNIRLIVPFTPAGQTDILARLLAQRLQEGWGRPVLVENRPGGNAMLGADIAAKAAPDGHTLLAITLAHAVNASLFPQAPYDFLRDLTTLTVLGSLPLVVVVRAGAPWPDLAALLATARTERLNGGSSGTGTPPHIGLELLRRAAGAGDLLQHAPYRGGAPSITDLVAGTLDVVVSNLPECLPQIQAGRLRALAVTGPARHPLLPTVPTAAELGVPQLSITSWTAVQAPAGLPAPLAERLAGDLRRALAEPVLVRKAEELGFTLSGLGLEESRRFVAAETARYAALVEEAGIRPDQ
ncbi:tripartite tricarboxylate transporter substrate-binding protein [Roseomonas sp. GC11]|uniref:Bug family tripartite tricarboxylate transporter substrate binding protein n=1 Tax=Roseomonas sp. GC11 TaxID=2950546 RepID=UPI00210D2CD1|nr:tripartite tricarboxylate transporter substrate-binding protein [Roseomonas sp. GC11]MCQ4159057.1 tripartite tricarboxylate transporter substrate-binding protein [Roseomonas sp. GC11]